MPFPLCSRVAAVLAGLALLATGCGNDNPYAKPTPSVSQSAASERVGSCPATSPALTKAKMVAAVDLDGDQQVDTVKLTAAHGPCPNLVFADTSKGVMAAQVPTDGPPVTTVQGFVLAANSPQLLVTRQDHPRGGFQVRLWSSDGSQLRQLTDAQGNALVPFVATDVNEHPLNVDCAGPKLVVTEALPHNSSGGSTWDVRRTTYQVEGGRAKVVNRALVARNASSQQIQSKYPALAGQEFFKNCTPS